MAATLEGNRKSHRTMREKLGEDGYKAHMASIGSKGGKRLVKKGGLLDPKNRRHGVPGEAV